MLSYIYSYSSHYFPFYISCCQPFLHCISIVSWFYKYSSPLFHCLFPFLFQSWFLALGSSTPSTLNRTKTLHIMYSAFTIIRLYHGHSRLGCHHALCPFRRSSLRCLPSHHVYHPLSINLSLIQTSTNSLRLNVYVRFLIIGRR